MSTGSPPPSSEARRASLPCPAVLESARLEDRASFITADGSSIRELAGIPTGNAAKAYRDLAKEVLNGAKARQHA